MKTSVEWEWEKHSHMMLSVIKVWVIRSWITRARQWGSRGDHPIHALNRGRWLLSFSHFPFLLRSKCYTVTICLVFGWLKFATTLRKDFPESPVERLNRKLTSGTGAVEQKSGRTLLRSIGGSSRARSVLMMPFICGKLTYMFYGYVFKMLPPAGLFSLYSDHSSSWLPSYRSTAGSCLQKVMFER